jgi:hypothetical protein
MEERKGVYRVSVGGHLSERDYLEDLGIDDGNIKIDLQEVGWSIDWIDLTWDRDRW